MLGALAVAGAALLVLRLLGGVPQLKVKRESYGATQTRISELTEYASKLRGGNKFTGAEKVYLEILNLDHKHVPTYNRLGTLYSAMRNGTEAVECFRMATQLQPSGSTFYNLGLSYFENKNYIKAIAAFEKSVMFEPTVQRYVGLAKTFKKIGKDSQMVGALEQALALEESPRILWLLADGYDAVKQPADAERMRERIRAVDPDDERLTDKKVKKSAKPAKKASARG